MNKYGSIDHVSTVFKASNMPEQLYYLTWAKQNSKRVSDWMMVNDNFPIWYSFSGDIVGWTNLDDRALNYKTFNEFIEII